MNPEAEAREQQTAKLRDLAKQVSDDKGVDTNLGGSVSVHLRQAANEIEDLAKIKAQAHEAQAVRLQRALIAALNEFCQGECDGFEPQISVGPIYNGRRDVWPITAKVQLLGIGTEALDVPPPPMMTVRLDVSLKGNL